MSGVKVECGACGATGLYQGFAEEKGYPVICVRCNGSGARMSGKLFTGRKKMPGVKGVRVNSSGTILSAGSKDTMTYEQFERECPEG